MFNVVSEGAIPVDEGTVWGALIVLAYTIPGGLWAVAVTDFVQMLVIVAGMSYIGWLAADMAGGFDTVLSSARAAGKLSVSAPGSARELLAVLGAMAPLALGSIPQQDTYQRVMSARDERTAIRGALIGGVLYFLLALIPMSLAYTALLIDSDATAQQLGNDSQLLLPRLVLDHMPLGAQVVFFGALLSAILSSASGALLAPSVAFTENVLRPLSRRLRDRELLWATRMTLACFTLIVVAVALNTHASIYELVERAYQITVVAAFVPLTAGLYWRRATTAGAIIAGAIGTLVWIACEVFAPDALLPPAIAGLVASAGGMLVGSLVGGLPAVRR